MTVPAAIRRFELLWWGSFVVWLAATLIAWERNQQVFRHAVGRNPQGAPVVALVQPITVALCLLVTVLLWFLIARRASNAARWIAAVFAGLATLRTLNLIAAVASARLAHPLSTGLLILATVLDVAAVAMLFGGAVRGWFVPFGSGDGETTE